MRIQVMTVGMLQEHAYILSDEKTNQAVIIDPGAEPARILEQVNKQGLKVEKILLTHGHFDHIGAVQALRDALGCEVLAHEAAPMYLEDADMNLSGVHTSYPISFTADGYFKADDQLIVAGSDELLLKVIFAPGHTADGVAFYHVASGHAFVGDIIFRGSIGRTDFPGGNAVQLMQSIQREIFTLPEDVVLHPGHGPETTVGYEKRNNPYFQWD